MARLRFLSWPSTAFWEGTTPLSQQHWELHLPQNMNFPGTNPWQLHVPHPGWCHQAARGWSCEKSREKQNSSHSPAWDCHPHPSQHTRDKFITSGIYFSGVGRRAHCLIPTRLVHLKNLPKFLSGRERGASKWLRPHHSS